jgi:hypothetical protein
MNAVWTIAALTVREAVRRKLVAAFALISVVLVILSGWGFYRLSHNVGSPRARPTWPCPRRSSCSCSCSAS